MPCDTSRNAFIFEEMNMQQTSPAPRRIPGRFRASDFYKTVSIKNRLRNYGNGYGLAETHLDEAGKRGVPVRLEERETGLILTAAVEVFREKGIPLHFPGFEPQVALPLRFWKIEDPRQPGLFDGLPS
jgi:hypothetical protein